MTARRVLLYGAALALLLLASTSGVFRDDQGMVVLHAAGFYGGAPTNTAAFGWQVVVGRYTAADGRRVAEPIAGAAWIDGRNVWVFWRWGASLWHLNLANAWSD